MNLLRAIFVAALCLFGAAAASAGSSAGIPTRATATAFELFQIKNAKALHGEEGVRTAWWQSVAQQSVASAPPGGLLLDTLSATARLAYATNKLRSAFAGSPVQVQRVSDTTTQDVPFSGNDLDGTSLTSFCTGTTCGLSRWYDQMALADCIQGTAAGQGRLYGGGAIDTFPNGRAAPRFGVISANTDCLVTQSNIAQPNTIVMVVKHNSQVVNGHWTDGNTASPRSIVGVSGSPATTYQIFAGTALTGGTLDTSAHLLIATFNNPSCTLSVDGVVVISAGACNTQGITNFVIGASKGSGSILGQDGPIGMYLLFNQVLSGGDQALILAYSQSTWGTP